jgi:hypothetical protein
MLGIQVTRHADGKTAAKAGTQVESKQGPRGSQVNRQDLHQFTGQNDLDDRSLQVFYALGGYSLIYTATNQYSCSANLQLIGRCGDNHSSLSGRLHLT